MVYFKVMAEGLIQYRLRLRIVDYYVLPHAISNLQE